MKRCPTCGLTLDDSQTFCTNDGTPLVAEKSTYDPGATLVVPPGAVPTAQPLQAPPPGQQTGWQSPPRQTAAPQMFSPVADLNQPTGDRPGKFVPALVGGVVTGILALFAAFLPVTAYITLSLLCFLWAMVGGAIAGKMYVSRSPVPVRTGEGAAAGVLAGLFGTLIYLTLDTIVAYSIQANDIEILYRQQGYSNVTSGMFFLVTGIFAAIVIVGLSTVGGIIGVAIFEKRKGFPMNVPPPPPGYGGPMAGGYR